MLLRNNFFKKLQFYTKQERIEPEKEKKLLHTVVEYIKLTVIKQLSTQNFTQALQLFKFFKEIEPFFKLFLKVGDNIGKYYGSFYSNEVNKTSIQYFINFLINLNKNINDIDLNNISDKILSILDDKKYNNFKKHLNNTSLVTQGQKKNPTRYKTIKENILNLSNPLTHLFKECYQNDKVYQDFLKLFNEKKILEEVWEKNKIFMEKINQNFEKNWHFIVNNICYFSTVDQSIQEKNKEIEGIQGKLLQVNNEITKYENGLIKPLSIKELNKLYFKKIDFIKKKVEIYNEMKKKIANTLKSYDLTTIMTDKKKYHNLISTEIEIYQDIISQKNTKKKKIEAVEKIIKIVNTQKNNHKYAGFFEAYERIKGQESCGGDFLYDSKTFDPMILKIINFLEKSNIISDTIEYIFKEDILVNNFKKKLLIEKLCSGIEKNFSFLSYDLINRKKKYIIYELLKENPLLFPLEYKDFFIINNLKKIQNLGSNRFNKIDPLMSNIFYTIKVNFNNKIAKYDEFIKSVKEKKKTTVKVSDFDIYKSNCAMIFNFIIKSLNVAKKKINKKIIHLHTERINKKNTINIKKFQKQLENLMPDNLNQQLSFLKYLIDKQNLNKNFQISDLEKKDIENLKKINLEEKDIEGFKKYNLETLDMESLKQDIDLRSAKNNINGLKNILIYDINFVEEDDKIQLTTKCLISLNIFDKKDNYLLHDVLDIEIKFAIEHKELFTIINNLFKIINCFFNKKVSELPNIIKTIFSTMESIINNMQVDVEVDKSFLQTIGQSLGYWLGGTVNSKNNIKEILKNELDLKNKLLEGLKSFEKNIFKDKYTFQDSVAKKIKAIKDGINIIEPLIVCAQQKVERNNYVTLIILLIILVISWTQGLQYIVLQIIKYIANKL